MPVPETRARRPQGRDRGVSVARLAEPLPMVEVVLDGFDPADWVTEALRSEGAHFQLLACRATDRGRRRLLRLFEVRTTGDGLDRVVRRLRARLSSRDLGVSVLGPDRALLRVVAPLPAPCAAAFDLGDFCITCPFFPEGESTSWSVLVPQIADARQLLRASGRTGGKRPALLRAVAYRDRGSLSARQEDALRTAFQLGYFDYPRKVSLGGVARELGISRSTALELLRRGMHKMAGERFRAEPPLERLR